MPSNRLPAEFADDLRRLYPRRRATSPELAAVIAAAKHRGWTYASMAEVLGFTRERARQLAATAPKDSRLPIEIPYPPAKPEPVKRQWPHLTAEQTAQLCDLRGRAQPRGRMPADHPARGASRDLARLLQTYLDDGHRLIDLARVLDITKTAVRFRLGRHGYRGLPPSQQHGISAHDRREAALRNA